MHRHRPQVEFHIPISNDFELCIRARDVLKILILVFRKLRNISSFFASNIFWNITLNIPFLFTKISNHFSEHVWLDLQYIEAEQL